MTLIGSAALTWAVRRPAERLGRDGLGHAATALSTPFVLSGGLKIVDDLLLYRTFRDVKEQVEG